MYSLVYASSATVPFSSADLQALLGQSRQNNAAMGVTGMLLYRDGNFMQLLEGERDIVDRLYSKIAKDPRHATALVLLAQEIPQRAFSEWSMAFRDLNDPQLRALPGFSSFLNDDTRIDSSFRDPTHAQRLLQFFKQSMR